METKKFYYYIICLVSLFIFAWGITDLASSSIGLLTSRSFQRALEQTLPSNEGEVSLDIYYQKKILFDRLYDSVARTVVSGLIFIYSRTKANRLEKS